MVRARAMSGLAATAVAVVFAATLVAVPAAALAGGATAQEGSAAATALPPVVHVGGAATVADGRGREATVSIEVSREQWFASYFYWGSVTVSVPTAGRTIRGVVFRPGLEDAGVGGARIRSVAVDASRLPWWSGLLELGVTDGAVTGGADHVSSTGGPDGVALDGDVVAGDLVVEREGMELTGVPGTQVSMDFPRDVGFYGAPFPSDELQNDDGSVRLDGFPNPGGNGFVAKTLAELRQRADGFGVSSGIFLQTSAAVDRTRLPDVHRSVEADSPVFLVGVDPHAPDYLRRYPVDARFEADGGPYGAKNLLSLLPLQGVPLREGTRYAAVVLRGLGDAFGLPLGVPQSLVQLARGEDPPGLAPRSAGRYRDALGALEEGGVSSDLVAGLTVFTTGSPTRELGVFRDAVLERPLPHPDEPLHLAEVFDDYCVYESTIVMPDYQGGTPPFFSGGGAWQTDADGRPVLQTEERANFVLTIPRRPMPAAGFPLVVFSRTGGGGERPLVDRGPHAVAHGPAVEAGTGPALQFARAGFAGVSVDGPHGGLRNVTGLDEQLLIFNFLNPAAMRDNIRQSALELVLQAHVMETMTFDASDCPGAVGAAPAEVKFDRTRFALMGHSMGATIAQPALAMEPLFGAVILSGAGASWIENILYKKSPLDVRTVADWILLYPFLRRTLSAQDPVLSLVQWAGEASDAPAYNRRITERAPGDPRPQVLMLQGIVDTYILPPIANATSLSLGLDLAGEPLDAASPELTSYRPLGELLDLVGSRQVPLPVGANKHEDGGDRTAVVVQHAEDGIEDGHEVVFQTEGPKRQYGCFLEGFSAGAATVCP